MMHFSIQTQFRLNSDSIQTQFRPNSDPIQIYLTCCPKQRADRRKANSRKSKRVRRWQSCPLRKAPLLSCQVHAVRNDRSSPRWSIQCTSVMVLDRNTVSYRGAQTSGLIISCFHAKHIQTNQSTIEPRNPPCPRDSAHCRFNGGDRGLETVSVRVQRQWVTMRLLLSRSEHN